MSSPKWLRFCLECKCPNLDNRSLHYAFCSSIKEIKSGYSRKRLKNKNPILYWFNEQVEKDLRNANHYINKVSECVDAITDACLDEVYEILYDCIPVLGEPA